MGIGGGGTGTYSLQDHTHTNADEDGGALVGDTTLVDAETLDTWFNSSFDARVVTPKMTLVDNYETGTPESSHTFTPSTAIELDEIIKFKIIWNIGFSSISAYPQFTFNGLGGTSYDTQGGNISNTPAQTLWKVANQSEGYLADTSLQGGVVGAHIFGVTDLFWGPLPSGFNMAWFTRACGNRTNVFEISGGTIINTVTQCTELLYKASAGNFTAGSTIQTYKVLL